MLSPEMFNLILAYYAACGLVTALLAFIGGKASVGMRVVMGILGILLAGYAGYVYFGEVTTVYMSGRLAVLPLLLVIAMAVGMATGGKSKRAKEEAPSGPIGPGGFPTVGAPTAPQGYGYSTPGQPSQQGQPGPAGQQQGYPTAGHYPTSQSFQPPQPYQPQAQPHQPPQYGQQQYPPPR